LARCCATVRLAVPRGSGSETPRSDAGSQPTAGIELLNGPPHDSDFDPKQAYQVSQRAAGAGRPADRIIYSRPRQSWSIMGWIAISTCARCLASQSGILIEWLGPYVHGLEHHQRGERRGSFIMKILLVDDSQTIRKIQKKVLAQLGFHDIVEAGDGVEALAAYKQSPPDLMLIDWHMPDMDGITLAKTIRRTDKSTPLIMCIDQTEKSRAVDALKAGVNNYMVKPFTAEALSQKIDETLTELAIAAS
jgi:two-component system chemotaxis response regulator CheY